MTVVVAIAAMAVAVLSGRARPRHRVLGALPHDWDRRPAAPPESRSVARMGGAGAALIGGIAVVGGPPGVAAGLALAAIIAIVPARRRSVAVRPDEVAIAIDLVAGCLDAGATLPDALDAAGMTSTGLLRERCAGMAKSLRAGATGVAAWQSWLDDPSLAGFARTAARTTHTGAAAAADFRRTATRVRGATPCPSAAAGAAGLGMACGAAGSVLPAGVRVGGGRADRPRAVSDVASVAAVHSSPVIAGSYTDSRREDLSDRRRRRLVLPRRGRGPHWPAAGSKGGRDAASMDGTSSIR